jgi:hypothetical protein
MYDSILITSYYNNPNGWRAKKSSGRWPGEEPNAPFVPGLCVVEVEANASVAGVEEGKVDVDGIADDLGQGALPLSAPELLQLLRGGFREPEGESTLPFVTGFAGAHGGIGVS